ncbi:MAG: PDZ domain-containing protein, partial [Planctomycetaceae bacterium]
KAAGLKPDDEILEVGGRAVAEFPDFRILVLTAPVETAVRLKRGDTELTVKVKLRGPAVNYGFEWRIDDVEPQTIIVTAVMPGSTADLAGLKTGHRILKVGEAPSGDRVEFRQQLESATDTVQFEVEDAGRLSVLNLQKFPSD